jgi:hypothetical protein
MKVLKKEGVPYFSNHYQDPEDLRLKEKVAQARKEKEDKEKINREYFDLKFEKWLEENSRDELVELVPPTGEYKGSIHLVALKDYFRENLFPGLEG